MRTGAPARFAVALLSAAAVVGVALTAPASAATRPPAPTSLAVHNHAPAKYLTWAENATGVHYVVQQARNSSFTTGVSRYVMRGPGRTFTPYAVAKGTTYWLRVRAVRSGLYSGWSNRVSFTATWNSSTIRVLTYNMLSAAMDGTKDPGGVITPYWKHTPQRRPGQLSLMKNSGADILGLEEGAHCLITYTDGRNCYRQIESVAAGLGTAYTMADTSASSRGIAARYAGNYIFYKGSGAVAPVGTGGTWYIGTSSQNQTAAYQMFKVKSTGAEFLFVATHLITGRNLTGDQNRGAETTNMVNYATNYANSRGIYSIVFVGDFNSYVGEWHVDDISGNNMRKMHIPDGIEVAQHYYKAQYDSCNQYYRTATHGHGSIDHIYATGGTGVRSWGELINLTNGKFVGAIPSDHNPVWAAVAIPY